MREVVVLALAGMILFGGLYAVDAQREQAISNNGNLTEVTNESVNISGTAPLVVTLNESNRDLTYVESGAVTVEQNGTNFDAAGNWSWIRGNGTLEIKSGTQLNTSVNASNATVDYGWRNETDVQGYATTITLLPFKLGDVQLVILGAAAVLAVFGMLRRQQ